MEQKLPSLEPSLSTQLLGKSLNDLSSKWMYHRGRCLTLQCHVRTIFSQCLETTMSTFHQVMKFPTIHGFGKISSNQKGAWNCYLTATKEKWSRSSLDKMLEYFICKLNKVRVNRKSYILRREWEPSTHSCRRKHYLNSETVTNSPD